MFQGLSTAAICLRMSISTGWTVSTMAKREKKEKKVSPKKAARAKREPKQRKKKEYKEGTGVLIPFLIVLLVLVGIFDLFVMIFIFSNWDRVKAAADSLDAPAGYARRAEQRRAEIEQNIML